MKRVFFSLSEKPSFSNQPSDKERENARSRDDGKGFLGLNDDAWFLILSWVGDIASVNAFRAMCKRAWRIGGDPRVLDSVIRHLSIATIQRHVSEIIYDTENISGPQYYSDAKIPLLDRALPNFGAIVFGTNCTDFFNLNFDMFHRFSQHLLEQPIPFQYIAKSVDYDEDRMRPVVVSNYRTYQGVRTLGLAGAILAFGESCELLSMFFDASKYLFAAKNVRVERLMQLLEGRYDDDKLVVDVPCCHAIVSSPYLVKSKRHTTCQDMVALLNHAIQNGADPNRLDCHNRTALMVALRNNWGIPVVLFLARHTTVWTSVTKREFESKKDHHWNMMHYLCHYASVAVLDDVVGRMEAAGVKMADLLGARDRQGFVPLLRTSTKACKTRERVDTVLTLYKQHNVTYLYKRSHHAMPWIFELFGGDDEDCDEDDYDLDFRMFGVDILNNCQDLHEDFGVTSTWIEMHDEDNYSDDDPPESIQFHGKRRNFLQFLVMQAQLFDDIDVDAFITAKRLYPQLITMELVDDLLTAAEYLKTEYNKRMRKSGTAVAEIANAGANLHRVTGVLIPSLFENNTTLLTLDAERMKKWTALLCYSAQRHIYQ